VGDVRGLRVAYVSTAPDSVLRRLSRYLEEEYGCEVVGASGALSDRRRLAGDLDQMEEADAYLTEIKAAAIDVISRRGHEENKPVFYCDNEPLGSRGHDLDDSLLSLARLAVSRFGG
jgi:cyclic 2,3-diphosphoglycerate synthetase